MYHSSDRYTTRTAYYSVPGDQNEDPLVSNFIASMSNGVEMKAIYTVRIYLNNIMCFKRPSCIVQLGSNKRRDHIGSVTQVELDSLCVLSMLFEAAVERNFLLNNLKSRREQFSYFLNMLRKLLWIFGSQIKHKPS